MIEIVDDTRKCIHIIGMNSSHISSLCECLLDNCNRDNIGRLTIVQKVAREIPAHTFYLYGSVHLFFLNQKEVEILSAMIIDTLFQRCNFFLDEILEALTCALETVDVTSSPES